MKINLKVKNFKNKLIYAFLISLAIHLALIIWSHFVKISLYAKSPEPHPRLINVKITKEATGETKTDSQEKIDQKQEMPSADDKPSFVTVDRPQAIQSEMDVFDKGKSKPVVSAEKSGALKLSQVERKDIEVSKAMRRSTRKRLVEIGEIPKKDFDSGAPQEALGQEISKAFMEKSLEGMIGRDLEPVPTAREDNAFSLMKNFSTAPKRKTIVSDLGETLTYELLTYKDPKDGRQYFKVSIKVKTVAPNLPSLPKEIIFVLDASKSIGEKRLKEFKEGLAYILKSLNPQDYFNIIIFKEATAAFNDKPLLNNPENIKLALAFIEKVNASEKTDMYAALQKSLHLESSFKPSYRLVLSDGFPTKGVTDSRTVINEIAQLNNGKIPIFSFGGGVSISKYMLDFIAYKNRGWSKTTGRDNLIGRELSAMYDQIKDPILLIPRYYTSGLNENDLYPKILPDFFRGAEFTLYGTYTDENKFELQLLGDLIGQTKQVVIHGELKTSSEGGKEIARQWAFHKVYNLIGQLKHNADNSALLKEIDALSAKFDIVTPYSRNFRK